MIVVIFSLFTTTRVDVIVAGLSSRWSHRFLFSFFFGAWFSYSEVTVVELYQKEGADLVGGNASALDSLKWSSMLHPRPRVVSQSFILPSPVVSAAVTTTKFGIANKQV